MRLKKGNALCLISKSGGARMMKLLCLLIAISKNISKIAQIERLVTLCSVCTDPNKLEEQQASYAMLGDKILLSQCLNGLQASMGKRAYWKRNCLKRSRLQNLY